ncbi:MAG: thioesterase family protein [Pseudomonadota bacterium]
MASPEFVETYRGHVPAWHCDTVEHFTVAYYFERLERVTARFLSAHGIPFVGRDAPRSTEFYVRYSRELRASAGFYVESCVLAHDGPRLRLGHRIVDVQDGAVCTTVEQTLEGAALESLRADVAGTWDGPDRDERVVPSTGVGWVRSVTDVLLPDDTDIDGVMRLSAYIHRFSGSGNHLMTEFGWTAAYENEQRIGFSTFEFQLLIEVPPRLGDAIDGRACVARIGNSSVHIVHQLMDASTQRVVATLHQLGVHLDKDARRPSAIPAPIRDAVAQFNATGADHS